MHHNDSCHIIKCISTADQTQLNKKIDYLHFALFLLLLFLFIRSYAIYFGVEELMRDLGSVLV